MFQEACNSDKNCILCNSKKLKRVKAKFSDFIVDRVFNGKQVGTDIIICRDCGFEYSSYRFKDIETNKLYNGYRNSEYQAQRQKSDSWYTPEINELIGKNPIEIDVRKSNLCKILESNIEGGIKTLTSVLDYGGDKGQFIPKEIPNKFVYDISNIDLIEGISVVDPKKSNVLYDLVMCCHVLEHVVNPLQILEEISTYLKPNGYLYIELPYDLEKKGPFDNLYYLFNKYYSLKNILNQFIKIQKERSRIVSEHINFYTPNSVEQMLTNNNFKILQSSIHKFDLGWNKASVISVLAKKI